MNSAQPLLNYDNNTGKFSNNTDGLPLTSIVEIQKRLFDNDRDSFTRTTSPDFEQKLTNALKKYPVPISIKMGR